MATSEQIRDQPLFKQTQTIPNIFDFELQASCSRIFLPDTSIIFLFLTY